MLTERTRRIKDSLFAHHRQVDLERALLYTESYRATEGQPTITRRALALRHLLEHHAIVIDGDDLLVGNRTATPRAGVVSPEMSPYWILDELDQFPTRPQDRFDMSEADKETYRTVLPQARGHGRRGRQGLCRRADRQGPGAHHPRLRRRADPRLRRPG